MKVSDIYEYIDKIAPFNTCDKFDNVGLLVGNMNAEIHKVLLATDITGDIIYEAIEKEAELIVTHHPVIFNPLKTVTENSICFRLVENGISVISAHTNLDMAKGGISDMMLELMGFESSNKVLEVIGERDGKPYGYGKIVKLDKAISSQEFIKLVKNAFEVTSLRYTDSGKPIKRFAVCSGSGGSNIELAAAKKCDAYVTGDCKHNHFVDAKNMGLTLIDAGHYHTERIFAPVLANKLKKNFDKLCVEVAENDIDPAEYL